MADVGGQDIVLTAMIGPARRRSRSRRSVATFAPTSTVIATPRLPMMSKVVPGCGPAVNSVQEIAVRVGYDTGTALSRVFAYHEGISPGAWRRNRRDSH